MDVVARGIGQPVADQRRSAETVRFFNVGVRIRVAQQCLPALGEMCVDLQLGALRMLLADLQRASTGDTRVADDRLRFILRMDVKCSRRYAQAAPDRSIRGLAI